MDSEESTSRKYDLDIDHWVNPFRMPSRRALREAAGRTKNPPITSSPLPMGLQDGTPSKQDADVGVNTFEVISRTQRTEASQSRDLQIPSNSPTIDSQNCIASKQDMDLGPKRVIMPSLTQRTAGRLSLVIPPPLPQGMPGPQNRTPKSLDVDLDLSHFEIASRAQLKKARQLRSVPVLPSPPRTGPRNHFDVLRPDPYRVPSRGQREAVFKATERLRALEPCITIPILELPAELRLIIYKYALTSQSPITPRLKGARKAESKETQADAAGSSAQANASSLALLQTCRLVNREARPVYYASNTFRFTSAKDLALFLHRNGPGLLNELRKLHIEGLLTFKCPFTEEHLERFRRQGSSDATCQRRGSMRTAMLGDDADAAAHMLRQCKRLHRIHFVMDSRNEKCHIFWLLRISGYGKAVVDLVDDSHWAVRLEASAASATEWFKVLVRALADPKSRRALFPDLEEGQQRCIDVDLDMNHMMKELQSGEDSMAI